MAMLDWFKIVVARGASVRPHTALESEHMQRSIHVGNMSPAIKLFGKPQMASQTLCDQRLDAGGL